MNILFLNPYRANKNKDLHLHWGDLRMYVRIRIQDVHWMELKSFKFVAFLLQTHLNRIYFAIYVCRYLGLGLGSPDIIDNMD